MFWLWLVPLCGISSDKNCRPKFVSDKSCHEFLLSVTVLNGAGAGMGHANSGCMGSDAERKKEMEYKQIKKARKSQVKQIEGLGGWIKNGIVFIPEGYEGVVRLLKREGLI